MDEEFGQPSGDPGYADVPSPWQPPRLPFEERQLGLTRHTEEGALLEFAASLDSSKKSHIVIAWVLLVAFALPPVLVALSLLSRAGPW
jgi:hypothetical protein